MQMFENYNCTNFDKTELVIFMNHEIQQTEMKLRLSTE